MKMMKKLIVLIRLLPLFLYIQPAWAYDYWGDDGDIVYDWGAGLGEDVIIEGNYDDGGDDPWPDPWDGWPSNGDTDDWDDEYPGGFYNPHGNGGNGGSNGNGNGGKVPAGRNSLPPEAKASLEEKLKEMLEYCVYAAMLNFLSDQGAEFSDIELDPSFVGGAYNPCTDQLFFKDIENITESFPEEFIHFFQDNYYLGYPGGICDYHGTSIKNNIEFEAKLMQDILNHYGVEQGYNPIGGVDYGAGQNLSYTYWYWIEHLTNDGTSMPTPDKLFEPYGSYTYWDFMSDWAIRYGNVSVDLNFNPQIFTIFNECQ